MPASSTEESEVRDPWVTRMISLPAMGCAAVSADGCIADDDGQIGSLFDWMAGGDVEWKWSESDEYAMRSTQASKDFMQSVYTDIGAVIMGGGCSMRRTAGMAYRHRVITSSS